MNLNSETDTDNSNTQADCRIRFNPDSSAPS